MVTGTDRNRGITARIITIIQMLRAWVTVIMETLTLPTKQDTIKVILALTTNSMPIAGGASIEAAEDSVAAGTSITSAVVVLVMGNRGIFRARTT
jgi:hypothetical protein